MTQVYHMKIEIKTNIVLKKIHHVITRVYHMKILLIELNMLYVIGFLH